MRKALLSLMFLLFSACAFAWCGIPVTLANANIPCASGLSSDPSRVHADLWIQGLYNGADNVGVDSTGVDIMDETCLFDGTSILGPWQDCASGNPGEYYLFTDWSNYLYDGCPSTASTERAILLIYDDDGKYVLQSRSQGKDWDNWDEIGTTAAAVFSAATGSASCSGDEALNERDFALTALPNSVIYGAYAPGDAPPSALVTEFRLYFSSGSSAPTDISTSAWTAGNSYPVGTTSVSNYAVPAGSGWVSRALIFEGKELPFVSTNYSSVHAVLPGTAADGDPCSCSGISYRLMESCDAMDVMVDGAELFSYWDPDSFVYSGTCGVQHLFQHRLWISGAVSCWSPIVTATDASQPVPSQPSIISVTDNDPGARTGVTITYTAGSPAYRHDLYRDGYLVQEGFVSGSIFSNLDCNVAHDFAIGAISDATACYTTLSTAVSGTDQCAGAPPEIAAGLSESDALVFSTDETTVSWPSFTGATGYRLYRGTQADLANLPGGAVDNSCTRYDGANTNIDLTSDTPPSESFFWYLVTAYNGSGEGPAGTGRIINSSGECP